MNSEMDHDNRPSSNLERHAVSLEGLIRNSPNNTKTQSIVNLSRYQEHPPSSNPHISSKKKETCSLEELQNMDEGSILRQLAYDIPFRANLASSEYLASSSGVPILPYMRTSNQKLDGHGSNPSINMQNVPQIAQKARPLSSNVQSLLKKFDSPRSQTPDLSKERLAEKCDCAETAFLRQQVEMLKSRLNKLQKLEHLETEVETLHQSYHSLITSTNKREALEKAMRQQLEMDKEKMSDENQLLKDQVELLKSRLSECDLSTETAEYYGQALFKIQELNECRERQEIELAAQRATLDEQRNHIQILEGALASAQEEARKGHQLLVKLQDQKFTRAVPRTGATRQHLRPVLHNHKVPGHDGLSAVAEDVSPDSPKTSHPDKSAGITANQRDELEARIRNLETRLTHDKPTDQPEGSKKTSAPNATLHVRTRSLNSAVKSALTDQQNSVSGNDGSCQAENSQSTHQKTILWQI